jgi:dCMP deaminase
MDIKIDWAIDMARHVSKLSKDPSTKVGAVIFDPKGRIVSAGFNGFARGVKDTPERLAARDLKLRMVLHAERNAMAFATAPLEGCVMVVTHPCCAQCAASLIQAGIAHVVYPAPTPEFKARWAEDYELAMLQFNEARVTVTEVQV